MTRYQILQRTKIIIEAAYTPKGCLDSNGIQCFYAHPDAAKFSLMSAVKRAIFDITGDFHDKRQKLFDDTMTTIYEQFTQPLDFIRFSATAPVTEIVKLIDNALEKIG